MEEEFFEYVSSKHPKWVIILAEEDGERILNELRSGYRYAYSDDMYRLFLKAQVLKFICDGSIYQLNKFV